MKILKKGKLPKTNYWWVGEIVACIKCGAKIKLQELDILDRVSVYKDRINFTCPTIGCDEEIDIFIKK